MYRWTRARESRAEPGPSGTRPLGAADPAVTVIIPTRALPERAESLRCAIESVVEQAGVRALPLLMLNGAQRCAEVERAVRADRRVRVISRDEADLPAALRAGREAVDTPWFATLDDDDLLLPGALALRVGELVRDPDCAAVVTNGFWRDRAGDRPNVAPDLDVAADPLRALLRRNWLLPGSWLCRSSAVGAELFDGMPRYLECTWLAVRFATAYRMRWRSEPTVVYRVGSPMAESLSREYVLGQVDALRRILALHLPDDVWRAYRARISAAYHSAAERDWRSGRLRDSWRWHLASLREPRGWRYLPFTRHLLRASWPRLS